MPPELEGVARDVETTAAALQPSLRDTDQLRPALERWLATGLPAGSTPTVSDVSVNSGNGLSSETLLFTAHWADAGEVENRRLVARVAPDQAVVPVFPSYDLQRQFDVIRLVGELSDVPVPRLWWFEPDAAVLGAPFFVMDYVDGVVPPDVMPYNFGDNWLFDAPAEDQRRLQDATVRVLADLHGIDRAEERFDFLAFPEAAATRLDAHVAHTRAWYDFVAADGTRSELIERAFRWLDDNRPRDEGDAVVAWGDSRIGNVLYREFEPVAVLDWEMAGLGPRELDLAWLIYGHMVFEHLAHAFEFPGMPHFLDRDDVASTYESLTGHAPRALDFYLTYAALQWGIVFLRTSQRQIRFGELEMPDDVDELLRHREQLEAMIR